MAAILLPQPRLPQKAVPQFIDWGVNQKAPLGGAYQRLDRLGSRYALEITYPRLRQQPDGRVLSSIVRRALVAGAAFAFPQPGLAIGNPGSPVVNGGGQGGSILNIRGFTPGYIMRQGQFFSLVVGDRRYLYEAVADTAASGDGTMTLPIFPMIRKKPDEGAVCEVAQPIIQGILSGTTSNVELTIAKAMIPTFLITERA